MYLVLKKGEQARFMRVVRNKTNMRWVELANYLNVSKGTICHILKERTTLREEFFLKLCNLSNLDPKEFRILKRIHISYNCEVIPPIEINSKLAELVGIYLGDGHIYKKGLIITCGTIDESYITRYIPQLIEDIFNKIGGIYYFKTKKAIQYRIYSKEIVNYLENKFDLKLGKKRTPIIPKAVFEEVGLLKYCIKGLIDTDGGLYRHHKNNLQIVFFNSKLSLIHSLKTALESLKFNPRIGKNHTGYCVYLFGKEAKRYSEEIGFSNTKNRVKYNYWLRYSRVPLNTELECASRGSNPDRGVGNAEY